ncbi:hypothetical protein B0H17DRAFT_934565, partial [Mycena rosella]
FIWDILNNLRSDYKLLFKRKFHVVCIPYVLSRIGSLGYVFGTTIFVSYPLAACNTAFLTFNAFFPIGTSASALLWFFRLRAIYGGDRTVTFIFGFLWLAVAASTITLPIGATHTISLANPTGCLVVSAPKAYESTPGVVLLVYDTLVFLAISFRLGTNFTQTQQQTPWTNIKALLSGSNLPAFSKSLFTDGQIYYMITVILNILFTVMGIIPHLSPVYRGLLTVPCVTLTSVLACRVYRRTRLGVMRCDRDLTRPTQNPLGPSGNLTTSIPLSVVQLCTESTESSGAGDGLDSTANEGETLGAPSKANTLSFQSGTPHDISTSLLP